MNCRGIALVAVLWVLTLLAGLSAAAMVAARQGAATSRNRMIALRASWASGACQAILRDRFEDSGTVPLEDSVDLGNGTWCRGVLADEGDRVHVNRASNQLLYATLRDSVQVESLLDWRDDDTIPRPHGAEGSWYRDHQRPSPRNAAFEDVRELTLVRGFEQASPEALERLFTVHGGGRLNVNTIPQPLLAVIPGLGAEAVAGLLAARRTGRPIRNLDALSAELSPEGREALLAHYDALVTEIRFDPSDLMLHTEGAVGRHPLRVFDDHVVQPVPGRGFGAVRGAR